MGLVVALTIIGGLKRFSLVASAVVPIMAIFYVGSCVILIFCVNLIPV